MGFSPVSCSDVWKFKGLGSRQYFLFARDFSQAFISAWLSLSSHNISAKLPNYYVGQEFSDIFKQLAFLSGVAGFGTSVGYSWRIRFSDSDRALIGIPDSKGNLDVGKIR